jgi:hypothetical protein
MPSSSPVEGAAPATQDSHGVNGINGVKQPSRESPNASPAARDSRGVNGINGVKQPSESHQVPPLPRNDINGVKQLRRQWRQRRQGRHAALQRVTIKWSRL